MGCRQCLPLSVVQLKGKHCRKPHCSNGVVDTFEPCPYTYMYIWYTHCAKLYYPISFQGPQFDFQPYLENISK